MRLWMTTTPGIARAAAAALAIAFGVLAPPLVQASPQVLTNDAFWKDTAGNTIFSQGGGMIKVGTKYYWYGVRYAGAVTYANSPTKLNSDTRFSAVTAYSSTDLVHWTFEGDVLPATAAGAGGPLDPSNWIGRLGVVYNRNTGLYVLITQQSGSGLGRNILFATSTSPTGPFVVHHLQQQIVNNVTTGSGDQTVFTDDDGRSYLIFSNAQGRQYSYVAPIRDSDSLAIEPAKQIALTSGGREGNALFKYNGVYYYCTSDLHGWNASHTYCRTANAILGPYSAEAVMAGTDADFSHVSQTGFFIPVTGTKGTTILFAGDRWSDFAGNGLGYNQWMPISFQGTTPTLHSVSQFNLDAATGTWTVGAQNNYALNPSFEADRVSQNALAGWTAWTNLTGANPNSNRSGGHTGNWSAQASYSAAYNASRYQTITGLPNGSYTLKAWVRSSGGQTVAQIFAKDFGGSQLNVNINTPISNWTQVSIPHVVVTNGQATIGMYTEAKANNWIIMDDFSFVRDFADAGADVKIQQSGLTLDRTTMEQKGTVTITNVSNRTLNGPLSLQVDGLVAGVTLSNQSGTMNGGPIVALDKPSLAPGETVVVTTVFKNPNKVGIAYTPRLLAAVE